MAILVADVGGTNARLGLAQDGALQHGTIARFRGEDYASFTEVLRAYLARQGHPAVTAACVAVAGPVSGGQARLTNRAWDFSEAELCRLTGADQALLINDMIALGHAVSSSAGAGARLLRAPASDAPSNGQKLVVNAGTGFNICALKQALGNAPTCLDAEEGHTGLSLSVWRLLAEHCAGSEWLDDFAANETLFSGRGLARLHQALHKGQSCQAEQVVAAAEAGDAAALCTSALYAEMFGLLCRDLALRFMPRDGLYLAGSVARSVAGQLDWFLRGFDACSSGPAIAPGIPLSVVENDLAALEGCLSAVGHLERGQISESIH